MIGKTKVRILHLRENLQKKFNYICFKQIIQKPNRGQLQQLFPSFMAGEYTSRQIEKRNGPHLCNAFTQVGCRKTVFLKPQRTHKS